MKSLFKNLLFTVLTYYIRSQLVFQMYILDTLFAPHVVSNQKSVMPSQNPLLLLRPFLFLFPTSSPIMDYLSCHGLPSADSLSLVSTTALTQSSVLTQFLKQSFFFA